MARKHRPRDEGAEINITPMLDIVFIMLIFFIVTTSFVKEAGIDVNRPSADTAQRKERGNILVAISPAGDIFIDKRKVELRSVRANIERLHAENPEGSVVVLSDKEAKTGILVDVMDQIRMAGIENISIAAQSKDE
jgi:biopolymer transport protein ExbD